MKIHITKTNVYSFSRQDIVSRLKLLSEFKTFNTISSDIHVYETINDGTSACVIRFYTKDLIYNASITFKQSEFWNFLDLPSIHSSFRTIKTHESSVSIYDSSYCKEVYLTISEVIDII